MLSEKDSCLRNLNWSDLMAEAPPKSILYGRRYLNLSTATDMCLQYVSKSEPHIGEIELTLPTLVVQGSCRCSCHPPAASRRHGRSHKSSYGRSLLP